MSPEEIQRRIDQAKQELRNLADECGITKEELDEVLAYCSEAHRLPISHSIAGGNYIYLN